MPERHGLFGVEPKGSSYIEVKQVKETQVLKNTFY